MRRSDLAHLRAEPGITRSNVADITVQLVSGAGGSATLLFELSDTSVISLDVLENLIDVMIRDGKFKGLRVQWPLCKQGGSQPAADRSTFAASAAAYECERCPKGATLDLEVDPTWCTECAPQPGCSPSTTGHAGSCSELAKADSNICEREAINDDSITEGETAGIVVGALVAIVLAICACVCASGSTTYHHCTASKSEAV